MIKAIGLNSLEYSQFIALDERVMCVITALHGRGILSALSTPPSQTPSHLKYLAVGVKTLLAVVESILAKGQYGADAESAAMLDGALDAAIGFLIKYPL
jgi:hypothetical protein